MILPIECSDYKPKGNWGKDWVLEKQARHTNIFYCLVLRGTRCALVLRSDPSLPPLCSQSSLGAQYKQLCTSAPDCASETHRCSEIFVSSLQRAYPPQCVDWASETHISKLVAISLKTFENCGLFMDEESSTQLLRDLGPHSVITASHIVSVVTEFLLLFQLLS